jgi:hypothetical protein
MFDWGTIYADGTAKFDGFVPNKWRIMAINETFLVIHSPGANWSDNGGQHYGAADISVKEIEKLMPGNEPGTWRVKLKRMSRGVTFHPTPSVAAKSVAAKLEYEGVDLAARIEARRAESNP